MKNARRRTVKWWGIVFAIATTVLGCFGTRDVGTLREEAGVGDDAVADLSSGPSPGERATRARHCASCHQSGDPADGLWSGSSIRMLGTPREMEAYGSNLTPDRETGIARRSDAQLARAIRYAVGSDGRALCGMPAFDDMNDDEAMAIISYLRELDPVPHRIPTSVCRAASAMPDANDATAFVDAAGDADSFDARAADASAMDAALDVPPPCAATLVINEVQTAGAGGSGDEFVEIHNASDCVDVSLAGFELRYASATSSTDSRRWLGAAGDTIGAHGYVVVAGAGYRGSAVPIGTFSNAAGTLAATGAGLGLYDAAGTRIDGVGYGASTTNLDVEHAPAASPPSASSLARIPDGHDTDDNRSDFVRCDSPTPGAANQCAPPHAE